MPLSFSAPVAPLFVPGDRPERFQKAAHCGADAVILDLEDAVASHQAKEQARGHVVNRAALPCPVIVRVNAVESPHFVEDLGALACNPPEGVMLAKTEARVDLLRVRTALGDKVRLIPLIETAKGLANLAEIATADGVSVLAFGSLDFALDLGCAPVWDALILPRNQIVLHSRLAHLPAPIDGVTVELEDIALIASDAHRAQELGFGGKLAIHPRQVTPIRAAFTPSAHDVAWAKQIMAMTETETRGAQRHDGQMIDRPVIERARRILSQSQSA